MSPDDELDDGRISILGRSDPEGYGLEIVDPIQRIRQVDRIDWKDYPDDQDVQELVEAFIYPYVVKMMKSETPFIIEFDCGEVDCYGGHVMTDEDWQVVE